MVDWAFGGSRRTFLRLCGATGAVLVGTVRAGPLVAQASASSAIKIGVVGSGKLGGAVGARWVKAGHEVFFSSRHPEALKGLVEALGPRATAGSVMIAMLRSILTARAETAKDPEPAGAMTLAAAPKKSLEKSPAMSLVVCPTPPARRLIDIGAERRSYAA